MYPIPTGWAPSQVLNAAPVPGATNSYEVPSFDLASRVAELNQQLGMVGQQGIPELAPGQDPRQYLQLLAASNRPFAEQLAGEAGLDFPRLMQEAAATGMYEGQGSNDLFSGIDRIGNFLSENPALFFGAPFLAAGLTGAFGAGSGSATASSSFANPSVAAGAADGLAPITVGASSLPGGIPAVDAAVAGAWGGAPMASFPSLAGVGSAGVGSAVGAAADGLNPITVGASRLPGGNPAVESAISSAWGGGSGVLQNLLGGMSGNWGPLIGGLLGAVDANNQPDSMTSSYAPAPELTGAGNDVLASLRALFANGGPGVAGADPASLAAISGLQNFAGGGGINPYLDTVFNTAADATRSRLSSEFARSGRNVGGADHAGFRSDELQNLAAGIYGPGFEAERSRQFSSLIPLLSGGDYLRNINQQQIDQPLMNAMRYSGGLNSLLPLFPGTNTQPLFNNPLAGFLGGAQLGSLFGG